jgi:MerR family copper efflux transcriptional regulator
MKVANGSMTVGAVAKSASVKIDTVRYYERRGLLPKPPRDKAGYRRFSSATVQRLRFIKHAQSLGFTLNEVKQLLALRITPDCTCADVRYRAQTKMEDIQRRIGSLRAMKKALQQLVSACTADGPASECSFLANLNNEEMR